MSPLAPIMPSTWPAREIDVDASDHHLGEPVGAEQLEVGVDPPLGELVAVHPAGRAVAPRRW